ncbi:LysR family transcriptional regulator [Streptomyces sp. NPDC000151]|uniref:LysR family transcriptional regulator n=1 Tax=Streptomyces sp. NPDC000151 TaxID=3154244 RepID=UPI00331AAAFC
MDANVTVRDLRAVLEVAERGSFARAADALWVSRATMSEQIRGIERGLGVRLFDRTTRSVRLTPAGRVFIDHAARLLADLSGMEEAVREAGEQPRGTVRLGLPAGVVTQRIWHVLSAFRRSYPAIELIFAETTIQDLIHAVQKGELDLSVAAWPAERTPTGVSTAELALSHTGVAVAPDHELAKLPSVPAEELADVPLVTFVHGFALRTIAEDFCRRAGLDPLVAMQSSVDETVSGLVRAKVGYSILTHERAAQDGLTLLPTDIPCPDRVLGLAWAQHGTLAPAAVRLRERIIDGFRVTS